MAVILPFCLSLRCWKCHTPLPPNILQRTAIKVLDVIAHLFCFCLLVRPSKTSFIRVVGMLFCFTDLERRSKEQELTHNWSLFSNPLGLFLQGVWLFIRLGGDHLKWTYHLQRVSVCVCRHTLEQKHLTTPFHHFITFSATPCPPPTSHSSLHSQECISL